jgi:formylglycine-generating enzyme required for sulfatase activity
MDCLAAELPEHVVIVEGFALDTTEVTVAEFRAFVSGFSEGPTPGEGAHPDDAQSGWQATYDEELPRDADALQAVLDCDGEATYTSESGANDDLPVNCVTWYEATAFCISRGGRLPSEAEWEFAAAGGDDNRLYPWGSEAVRESLATVYPSALAPAGSLPDGDGRWQHADLAGNVWEWVLDWLDPTFYESVGDACVDCLSVAAGTHRGLRGGAFSFDPSAARAAARSGELPGERKRSVGFRCAYDE